jgi:hypothetical protein
MASNCAMQPAYCWRDASHADSHAGWDPAFGQLALAYSAQSAVHTAETPPDPPDAPAPPLPPTPLEPPVPAGTQKPLGPHV